MAQGDRSELSPEAEQRITEVIRSLADDKVERGVDVTRPMRCDSCDVEKSPFGSSQYGAYALCNDCLLEFTILLARGEIDSVAEYMTKRPDDGPPLLDPRPANESSGIRAVPRQKLMPSNEPV